MKKNMVLMTVIALNVMSNAVAMVVKVSKNLRLKTFQQRHINKMTRHKKIENLQLHREHQLFYALEGDDVEMADLLLRNYNINKDDGWMEDARSLAMIRLLEKYGCSIHGVNDDHGGNYLHTVISGEGTNNTKMTKDSFIKYAIERGVDPHAVNNCGENLWHQLTGRPFYFSSEKNHLLRRAKLLRSLHVDPHHKNHNGTSAIECVQSKIDSLDDEYKYELSDNYKECIADELQVCHKLLAIMNGERPNKNSNRE